LRRLEDRLFPNHLPNSKYPSGLIQGWPPEEIGWIIAVALGALFAIMLEVSVSANPIPPGGDPGEWLTTSYAYAGLPYPSWIIPGQYPPLLFPLLGLLVRIGGGPAEGARLYLGLIPVLVGFSTYYLARSLLRSPIMALLAEGLVLFNPSFMQFYYFGAYPNLLGLVFMNLALAFLIRYVRSRSGTQLFLFWAFAAATILTHSLVGAMMAASVGIVVIFLFWMGRIPRAAYRSRAGQAGMVFFAATVGGFYLVTKLLHVVHPAYLQSNAFAYVKDGLGQIFYLLLNPYFPHVHPSVSIALILLVAIVALLVVVLPGLRLFLPQRLTLGTLTSLSMILAVCVACVVGWELSIVTDYVRLGYFLVIPVVLAFAVFVDGGVAALRVRLSSGKGAGPSPLSPTAAPTGVDGVDAPIRVRRSAPASRPATFAAGFVYAIVAVGVIVLAGAYAAPAFSTDEGNNTQTGHDSVFLQAIHAIESSNISGNVLTVPGAVKWTRALLDRDAYAPILPARYSFDPSHIQTEELAYLALTDRFAVSNGNIAMTTLGYGNATAFANASPEFQAAFFGVFNPVISLPATNFSVTFKGGLTMNVTSSPTIYAPLQGTTSAMSLVYAGPGFVLNVTLTAIPGTTAGSIGLQAKATGPVPLIGVTALLLNPPGGSTEFGISAVPGEAVILPKGFGGALNAFANVTPAADLTHVYRYTTGKHPAEAILTASSPNGSAELGFSVTITDPGAANLISDLPSFVSTPDQWAAWGDRFVLYQPPNSAAQAQANLLWDEPQYLVSEFGATILGTYGPTGNQWLVILLPAGG
jgi:hypothetical protein